MKHTRTVVGVQHAFGFIGILQGHDLSAKVYSLVQKVERAVALAKVTLREYRKRVHSRQQLASMSAHMLRDIGVNRTDAEMEMNKPFWKK